MKSLIFAVAMVLCGCASSGDFAMRSGNLDSARAGGAANAGGAAAHSSARASGAAVQRSGAAAAQASASGAAVHMKNFDPARAGDASIQAGNTAQQLGQSATRASGAAAHHSAQAASISASDKNILELATGRMLNLQEFLSAIEGAQILLLGEEHDEYAHHEAEARILKQLASRGRLHVAMEMIDLNNQHKINEALKNKEQIKNIKPAIGWSERFDFEGYEAVLHSFFYGDSSIAAANLDLDEIIRLYAFGQPLSGERSANAAVQERLRSVISSHHADEDATERLVRVQQHKDRTMAQSLLAGEGLRVLLAGKYHVYKNLGVPLHLADIAPQQSVVVLSFEDHEGAKLASLEQADFIWIIN